MYTVVVHTKTGSEQHPYASKKIAEKQFEQSKLRPDIWFVTIVHSIRRDNDVIAYWEKPNLVSNEQGQPAQTSSGSLEPTRGQ